MTFVAMEDNYSTFNGKLTVQDFELLKVRIAISVKCSGADNSPSPF